MRRARHGSASFALPQGDVEQQNLVSNQILNLCVFALDPSSRHGVNSNFRHLRRRQSKDYRYE
jgi:hypothetical protein